MGSGGVPYMDVTPFFRSVQAYSMYVYTMTGLQCMVQTLNEERVLGGGDQCTEYASSCLFYDGAERVVKQMVAFIYFSLFVFFMSRSGDCVLNALNVF